MSINWLFVGWAVAGYITVWMVTLYVAIIVAILGYPLDARTIVAWGFGTAPVGAVFGATFPR